MANAWETLKRGDMLKTFVRSARSPVNMKFDSRTSFWTSREIFSTVPGFDSPKASLRSEKTWYESLNVDTRGLSPIKDNGEAFSSAISRKCRRR